MQIKSLMLLGAIGSALSLQGCTTLVDAYNHGGYVISTPTDMVKYHSPQEVIDKLRLNGRDGTGMEVYHRKPYAGYSIAGNYWNTYPDEAKREIAPYKLMENLCISQNGFFNQIAPSTRRDLSQDPDQVTRRPGIEAKIGTFKCLSDTQTWFVSIEPQTAREFDEPTYPAGNRVNAIIIMKTRVIDEATALKR